MAGNKGKTHTPRRTAGIAGIVFMLPGVFLMLFTIIIPLLWNIVLSFLEWNGNSGILFAGLDNYLKVFGDRRAYSTILKSLLIGLVSTSLAVVWGLFLALWIYRLTRPEGVFCRFIYFSVSMLPMIVVGLLFSFILAADEGLLNSLLRVLGLRTLERAWLANPKTVLWTIAAVQAFKISGAIMMLFYTSIIRIPPSFFEAGILEGADYLQELKMIILPLVKPTAALVVSLFLILAFKSYDIVWTMTKGGPGDISKTAPIRMIEAGFSFGQFGYAAAIGVVLTIMVGLSVALCRLAFRGERYEY
jgi:raffinose/stachyose/melibiose transport system permease protein